MATWQEIGLENFYVARSLYDAKSYRSSVSRFYYAAFSLLTYELARKGIAFQAGRHTPSHAQLSALIAQALTQFTDERRANIARLTTRLYVRRIGADYSELRVDKSVANTALRDTIKLFNYFGLLRGEA